MLLDANKEAVRSFLLDALAGGDRRETPRDPLARLQSDGEGTIPSETGPVVSRLRGGDVTSLSEPTLSLVVNRVASHVTHTRRHSCGISSR